MNIRASPELRLVHVINGKQINMGINTNPKVNIDMHTIYIINLKVISNANMKFNCMLHDIRIRAAMGMAEIMRVSALIRMAAMLIHIVILISKVSDR